MADKVTGGKYNKLLLKNKYLIIYIDSVYPVNDGYVTESANYVCHGYAIEPAYTFQISGALAIASLLQTILGTLGIAGALMTYIGPITIGTTISLISVDIMDPTMKACKEQWGIAIMLESNLCIFCNIFKSLCRYNCKLKHDLNPT